jgi:hypothetical protein
MKGYIMAKIILNDTNSPVQLQVKTGVAKETGREYEYLSVIIGDYETRVFFRSPLENKEVKRVLAEGADASLLDA